MWRRRRRIERPHSLECGSRTQVIRGTGVRPRRDRQRASAARARPLAAARWALAGEDRAELGACAVSGQFELELGLGQVAFDRLEGDVQRNVRSRGWWRIGRHPDDAELARRERLDPAAWSAAAARWR